MTLCRHEYGAFVSNLDEAEPPCSTGGMEQYAVKFFNVRKDYDLELELYQDEALRKVLPAIFHASDNSDGSAKSIRCDRALCGCGGNC